MATRLISTWRDPFGEGFSLCHFRKIAIPAGLTVLVGCNGSGKSTLLRNIQAELQKEKKTISYAEGIVEQMEGKKPNEDIQDK